MRFLPTAANSTVYSKLTAATFVVASILFNSLYTAPAQADAVKSQVKAAVKPATVQSKISAHYSNWGIEDMKNVWAVSEGSKNVIVAVVDTGIDPNHADLKDNLWKAPGSERATGGSVYGWDFVTNSANPKDTHGHGTHIAGIIGAVANAKMGVAGVAQKVSLMPVRYYSDTADGKTNFNNSIKALNYAIDNGAKVINYSGGGPVYVAQEFEALKRAEAKGILVITAAGNDGHDTDMKNHRYYPAGYSMNGLKNIISVASMDSGKSLLKSSNWGRQTVDIAAPGIDIWSTLPGNAYGKLSGTSQATAFISGLAALILSENPKLSPAQVKDIIKASADSYATLKFRVASGGKANARKAVEIAQKLAKTGVSAELDALVRNTASKNAEVQASAAKTKKAPKKSAKLAIDQSY